MVTNYDTGRWVIVTGTVTKTVPTVEGLVGRARAEMDLPRLAKTHRNEMSKPVSRRSAVYARIRQSPTSDNLSPQETTKHEASEGADGLRLSSPGSQRGAEKEARKVHRSKTMDRNV